MRSAHSANYPWPPVLPYLHTSRPPLGPMTLAQTGLARDLRRDVEILALDIGPRGVFAPDRYALAGEFLESSLTKAGYTARRQTFESHGVMCSNLEASITGVEHPGRIVVVGAHYDSVPGCPAANDNASGVAGVLAIARALRGSSFPCTVRFVLFANEEPPHFNMNDMGSQHYARAARAAGEDIRAMVCLETIGCYLGGPGTQRWPHGALSYVLSTVGDFIAFVGRTPSKGVIQRAAEAFERARAFPLLAAAVPDAIGMVDLSDHRAFNEVGYPAFMVTDTAPLRYHHYHLDSDTPDKLDFESMARVVTGLIAVARDMAGSAP